MKKIRDNFVIRLDNENQLFEVLTNIKENSDVKWVGNEEIEPEKDVEIFDVYRRSTCLVLKKGKNMYYDSIGNILEDDNLKNEVSHFNNIWE